MSKKQLATDFAFPTLGYSQGLTKRELFAAMAMQGYAAGVPTDSQHGMKGVIATNAVGAADALIECLEGDEDFSA